MTNLVRMLSNTVFQNDRVVVFTGDAPEGVLGAAAGIGSEIGADVAHARELHHLGIATAKNPADLDATPAPLEPHYTVSMPELQASRAASPIGEGLASDAGAPPPPADQPSEAPDLDGMTIAELRDFATTKGIDLGEATKKAEVQAAIKAGLAAASEG